jgi:two-component system, LytTR family, response regulator
MSRPMPTPEPASRSAGLTRVLIVDDEPIARDCIRLALQPEPDLQIVGECGDGPSAVEAIRGDQPDLVFLDVQMPGLDGFGVIESVGVDHMPAVVFVTAFNVHAVRAFEVHALDYVMKPFEDDRLRQAYERARHRMEAERGDSVRQQIRGLLREWRSRPGAALSGELEAEDSEPRGHISRFAVQRDGRVRFVRIGEIDWIEASGNYLVLHTGPEQHRIRAAIGTLIDNLDPARFVRIHRSIIVNLDQIKEVQPWFGGDYIAILRNGAKLRVSRSRAAHLLRPIA